MNLKIIEGNYVIYKTEVFDSSIIKNEFTFISYTDEELSVVCKEEFLPKNASILESNYKLFRIEGTLDFSLIGIIAKISGLFAENGISIFVVSTFNTDYILVKQDKFDIAISLLKENGYQFEN